MANDVEASSSSASRSNSLLVARPGERCVRDGDVVVLAHLVMSQGAFDSAANLLRAARRAFFASPGADLGQLAIGGVEQFRALAGALLSQGNGLR